VSSTARSLIAAITICSWIALSNHCAFSAVIARTTQTASGCPFHTKPAKPQQKPEGMACCKILRATAVASVKVVTPAVIDAAVSDFQELAVFSPPKISIEPVTLDTGPPGKTAFAESNRSMRAHAPPLIA
jgi:hypothetical protein